MSADASITMAWGDGEHRFRLAIGQLRELQDKCGAGPAEILRRVADGTWRVDDLREVLRLGLIGGGKAPLEALALVQRYVDERPLLESVMPARAVLLAALVGPSTARGKEGRRRHRTGGSPSTPSMAAEPSSGSHRPTST